MKKLMALSLALLMTLSLAACGSKTEQPSTGSNSSDAEATGFVPSKNVTWICTSSAGGGSDIFSRQIADIMKNEDLVNGQTIVISNETDGSGEVGRNKVATMKAGDADYTLLTFNSGDLMPMVQNTKNRSSNFRILAIMAVDKQLMFSCPASDAKTDYAKAGGDQNDFAAAIEAAKNGTFVVIGGSKGDDITTYQKLLAEVGLTEQQMGYITYDSTSDAITAALGEPTLLGKIMAASLLGAASVGAFSLRESRDDEKVTTESCEEIPMTTITESWKFKKTAGSMPRFGTVAGLALPPALALDYMYNKWRYGDMADVKAEQPGISGMALKAGRFVKEHPVLTTIGSGLIGSQMLRMPRFGRRIVPPVTMKRQA